MNIAGAVRRAREVAEDHAEAVVERHRDANAIGLGEPHRLADEEAVVEDVVVRERRALRRTGGPRRVLEIDGVVELQGALAFGERLEGRLRCRGFERAPSLVEDDRFEQRRAPRAHLGEHLDVVARAERPRQEERRAPDWFRTYSSSALVRGVDVHEDCAHTCGRSRYVAR
jgi:hypothetical protein